MLAKLFAVTQVQNKSLDRSPLLQYQGYFENEFVQFSGLNVQQAPKPEFSKQISLENVKRFLQNHRLKRCCWTKEELDIRSWGPDEFLALYGALARADKIIDDREFRAQFNYRPVYEYCDPFEKLQIQARIRLEKLTERNSNAKQIERIVGQLKANEELHHTKRKGVQLNSTFRQTLSKNKYPPPPTEHQITSYASIDPPLDIKFPYSFKVEDLSRTPFYYNYSLEDSLQKLI